VNITKAKIDIRSLNLEALQEYFSGHFEEAKNFRAKQVYEWLWK
jgi:23S rRNA (adenine2503-C2)-methyltransferase